MNNLSFRSLQGLLLLFLDKRDDVANKNEEFYSPSIKKILVTINGMSHQLFAAGLQGRHIYLELKNYFYREHSNVTWEELWIDTRSSIDNTLNCSCRAVEKSGILLQIEKVPETSGGDLTCYVFSLEDAVAHLSVTDERYFNDWKVEQYKHELEARMDLHLALCNFIALKRTIKYLLLYHSLVHFL